MDRISQLAPTGLFTAEVPRYTSYPTAPHFTDALGAEDMGRWIETLPKGTSLSLYLHIPFCERLCWFCACRTQGVRTPEPVASYLETLKAELGLVASHLTGGQKVTRIHWGGGTPTILKPSQITDLAGSLRAAFDVAPDAEFSCEIDPTLVDVDKIDALRRAGMDRASIGIQDFDPDIQRAIGREQSFDLTAQVVQDLRAAGINSLNTDIVYGLPGQTLEGIATSTRQLLSLEPDRIALFGYAHVPWVAKRQRMINPDDLPDTAARLALVEATETQLQSAGYLPIGIDHFAKPQDALYRTAARGQLRRNFQGYTDDRADALIGMGASAISKLPGGYMQNAPATAAYVGRIRAGALATSRGLALGLEDRLRAELIERLLCDLRVDLTALTAAYGTVTELLTPALDRILDRFGDWVTLTDGRLSLTPDAKPLARLIASEFDTYLSAGRARHSLAI